MGQIHLGQLEQRTLLSAGDLNAAFGVDGIYTRPSGATNPYMGAMAV